MTPIVFLLFLSPTLALQIKEIHNPILPVHIGKAKIITSKHTLIYHNNLTYPEQPLLHIKNYLINLQNTVNKKQSNNHFSLLLNTKINNALSLTDLIYNKVTIFSNKNNKNKKSLFNGIGKLEKFLFGTLDSDDEKHFSSYLENLQHNINKINDAFGTQVTYLKDISSIYNNNFQKLADNQKILQIQLSSLTKEINDLVNLEETFSLSNMIDVLLTQLHSIQSIINKLETAISFAHLKILHSSIIDPIQLKSIIIKLQNKYGNNNIPELKRTFNYYSLFTAQVLIQNKIILFKITMPITSSNYKFLQLYSIPIANLTIIPTHPFLLLNTEDHWTTSQRCPQVEDLYLCPQAELQKQGACLANLMKTGKNSCNTTQVYYSETSITQINANEVLIIPAKPTKIKSHCDAEGIYEVQKPSIISLGNCQITIDDKIFQPEENLHEECVFELPLMKTVIQNDSLTSRPLHLKQINTDDIQRIIPVINNLHEPILQISTKSHHPWINSTMLTLVILAGIAVWYFKIWQHRTKQKEERTTQTPQKIRQPLFSDRQGGVM